MKERWDAVIVGGGHNGLVAAAYLAKAGRSVLVLERRGELGGAAVSHRAFVGHDARLSRYAYLVSLLPRRIADDLCVRIELRTRAVAAYAPQGDGGLLVDQDPHTPRTAASFAQLGATADHAAFTALADLCDAAARRLFPTLLAPLPTRAQARALLAGVPGAWELLAERPLGESLRERFGHPLVRGVVATDGLIGTFVSLDDPSLRQNRCFLWHVVGGPWRVPVGGMGAVSASLAAAAAGAGAALRTGAAVARVEHGPRTSEVTWHEDGEERTAQATWVLAGVAPDVLARLEGRAAPPLAEGSQMKLNLLLDRLPRLRSGVAPEDAFAGTFRLHESESELAAAHADAAAGRLPRRPPAELYCHSLTDRSILGDDAPPGRHTLTLFGLHTPASLFDADEDGARAAMVERYLDALDEQLAEPIRDCIARDAEGRPCVEARTPLDLERELGLPRGNIFHGDLAWPWAGDAGGATAAERWGVATDHERTLLCGAGAVRGGGVSGVAGHNAAMAVLDAG